MPAGGRPERKGTTKCALRRRRRSPSLTGAVVSGALLGATPSMATTNAPDGVFVIHGTCGDTFNLTVGGGAAGWTLTCAGVKIRAQDW
jgi:hypothetical protein